MKASVSYFQEEAAQEAMIKEKKRLLLSVLRDGPFPSGLGRTDEAK